MEVPKEVVEVLKNAQVKLQDCLDCVYEDRDPPNESDCLAADRTHTLAKLMNNNTVAQLEAIFDFEDYGRALRDRKDKEKGHQQEEGLLRGLPHHLPQAQLWCGHAWLEANSEHPNELQ